MKTTKTCAVKGCKRKVRSKGFCAADYQKARMLAKTNRLPGDWALVLSGLPSAPAKVDNLVLPRGRAGAKALAAAKKTEHYVRGKGFTKKPPAPKHLVRKPYERTVTGVTDLDITTWRQDPLNEPNFQVTLRMVVNHVETVRATDMFKAMADAKAALKGQFPTATLEAISAERVGH